MRPGLRTRLGVLLLTTIVCWIAKTARSAEVPTVYPHYKHVQTLVAASSLDEKRYLAFPVLLPVTETDFLIGYKRGDSHASGQEAAFELRHWNPVSERLDPRPITLRQPGVIFQNGEFARFANGDIACYIDVQRSKAEAQKGGGSRAGLVEFRSTDRGLTFHEVGKFGPVEGVEYGYAFEAITERNTTWMLVMTFTNLTGGEAISPPRGAAGPVSVICTTDNGKTWDLVKNLTHELGDLPLNESTFMRQGDGFIISTRGYDNHQWLHVTDGQFTLRRQLDLNRDYPFVHSYVGRPRVFARDEHLYLLGRNFTGPAGAVEKNAKAKNDPMKLSLLRFDPATLAITQHVILDNAENESVTDGYYAVPYWQPRKGKTYFEVITYKRMADRDPDLLRLEYDWNEIR